MYASQTLAKFLKQDVSIASKHNLYNLKCKNLILSRTLLRSITT